MLLHTVTEPVNQKDDIQRLYLFACHGVKNVRDCKTSRLQKARFKQLRTQALNNLICITD